MVLRRRRDDGSFDLPTDRLHIGGNRLRINPGDPVPAVTGSGPFECFNVAFGDFTLAVVIRHWRAIYVVYVIKNCLPADAVGSLVVRCSPRGVAPGHDVIALPEVGARLAGRERCCRKFSGWIKNKTDGTNR